MLRDAIRSAGLVAGALGLVAGACVPPEGPPATVNAVEVLVEYEEVAPAVISLIEQAEDEVLLSMYLLGGVEAPPGDPAGLGREIVDALVERMEAGVSVRVLNTRMGVQSDPRSPEAVGPNDLWFHPVFDYARARGLPVLKPAPSTGTDHTKYLVVDGRVAIFGGMNLADAVASNHDLMTRTAGPIAAELQDLFRRAWTDALAHHLESTGEDRRAEWTIAASTADAELERARRDATDAGAEECTVALRETSPDAESVYDTLREHLDSLGDGDSLTLALLLLSEPSLVDDLIDAHKRGADVRVMLDPNESFFGVNCRASLNARAIAQLAEEGVPVRFYTVDPGQEMHLKVFVITHANGERIIGSGSANWTNSDMHHNWEAYGFFSNCAAASQVETLLDDDWNHHTRAVSAPELATFTDADEREALADRCSALMRTVGWTGRAP